MGFSTPRDRPEHHRARRKAAPRSLPALTAPDQSRTACASASHTPSRKAHRMPQARAAPTRGLRLPGKPPSALPRSAWWARAIPTRPRCPSAYGILRTPPSPCGQLRKALAEAAARALPAPLRGHRPIASSSDLPWHHHRCPPSSADSFLRLACPARSSLRYLPLRAPWGSLKNSRVGKESSSAQYYTQATI